MHEEGVCLIYQKSYPREMKFIYNRVGGCERQGVVTLPFFLYMCKNVCSTQLTPTHTI